MIRLIAALLCASLLSGCFFFGGGDAYKHYRVANGIYISSFDVDATCLSPRLKRAIASFENRFGRKIVMNSGFRDPIRNVIVGGQESSLHTRCMAADFFIPGVSKAQLIAFAMRNPQVGGLGCYPGREFIHIDVRDRPKGWTRPVTFSGC